MKVHTFALTTQYIILRVLVHMVVDIMHFIQVTTQTTDVNKISKMFQCSLNKTLKVFGIVQEETFFSVNFQSNNDGQHWTDCYDIHFNYPFATMCGNHGCCVASMYQQPYQCVNTDGASYIYNAETNQLELNFASAGQFAQSTVWMINSTYGFTGWDISGVTWSSGFQFHASYNNCTSC